MARIEEIVQSIGSREIVVGAERYSADKLIRQLLIYQQRARAEGDSHLFDELISMIPSKEQILLKMIDRYNQNVLALIRSSLENGEIIVGQNDQGEWLALNADEQEKTRSIVVPLVPKAPTSFKVRPARLNVQKVPQQETKPAVMETNHTNPEISSDDSSQGEMKLSTLADIPEIKNTLVHTLHLMKTDITTFKAMQLIIEKFPNLKKITVSPSVFNAYFVGREKSILYLRDRGIALEIHRFKKDRRSGSFTKISVPYGEQRQLYLSVFSEERGESTRYQEKRELLDLLDKHNVINLSLLEAYLGGEPTTLVSLAAEYDIPLEELTTNINAVLLLMGDTNKKTPADYQRAKEMLAKLQQNSVAEVSQ